MDKPGLLQFLLQPARLILGLIWVWPQEQFHLDGYKPDKCYLW
jgi:hypothetical protein